DKFSMNFIWRMLTGDITIQFLDAAVERMLNAQEVTDEVEPAKLRELQHHRTLLVVAEANPSTRRSAEQLHLLWLRIYETRDEIALSKAKFQQRYAVPQDSLPTEEKTRF